MMSSNELPLNCIGFDWDKENLAKNWEKHRVGFWECEEVFFNQPLLLADDIHHSKEEQRFYALGKTDSERPLFLAFTVRHKKIRVISARDMSRKERSEYRNAEEKDSKL
jgi:uncharacterized DUF497 family protein